jgi:hypothetical protein
MEPYTWNNVKLKNTKWGVQWFKLQNDQFSGHYPSLLSFETGLSLHPPVKNPTLLDLFNRASPYLWTCGRDRVQSPKYHLKNYDDR